jgi:hypothetical protein
LIIQGLYIINFTLFFLITLIIDIQCFLVNLFSKLTSHLFCFVFEILLTRFPHNILMYSHIIMLNSPIRLFISAVTCWLFINSSSHFIVTVYFNLYMWVIILWFSKFPRLWVFSIFSCLWSSSSCFLNLLSGFIKHTNSLKRFFSSPIRTCLNITINRWTRVKVLSPICVLLIPSSWRHSSSDKFFLLMIIGLFS